MTPVRKLRMPETESARDAEMMSTSLLSTRTMRAAPASDASMCALVYHVCSRGSVQESAGSRILYGMSRRARCLLVRHYVNLPSW